MGIVLGKESYMKIESTKNFEIFKKMDGNRPLDKNHLKKLMLSIQKENRLDLHPIIVNKEMCVIDGQHRLEIAKKLGVDIFYIQSDVVSDDHLQESNANQKSWEIENFIDLFAIRKKNPDYMRLRDLMKSTNLKPKALLAFLLGNVSPTLIDFIRSGKFKFPVKFGADEAVIFYLDFIAYVTDKRICPLSMFSNYHFTKALRWLINTNGFNTEIFFKKLDQKWFELKPQHNSELWYKLLISIYNFKNHDKISDEWTQTSSV